MNNQTTKRNYSSVALIVALVAFIAALLLSIVRGPGRLGCLYDRQCRQAQPGHDCLVCHRHIVDCHLCNYGA